MNKVLSELWDFVKKNFAILLIGTLFLIFYGNGCNRDGNGKNTSDTSSHTVQVPQPIIIMPPYQPQQQGNTVFPINIPQQYNPSQDLAKLTEQYNELVKQFLAVKTYRDSIQLKDTAGNRVGVVDLTQVVSENSLKSTQPSYKLNFPHTYTTITNTVYPKPKNKWYIGISAASLINSPSFENLSANLLIQNKKENIISLSGYYSLPLRQPGVALGYNIKLSLK